MTKFSKGYIVYVIVDNEQVDRIDVPFEDLKPMGFATKVRGTDKVCFVSEAIGERLFKYQ